MREPSEVCGVARVALIGIVLITPTSFLYGYTSNDRPLSGLSRLVTAPVATSVELRFLLVNLIETLYGMALFRRLSLRALCGLVSSAVMGIDGIRFRADVKS